MRVTSEFWVSALLRRAQGEGAFATVVNRGATSAGAIYVVVSDMQGGCNLIAPAPQSLYEEPQHDIRKFEVIMSGVTMTEISQKLEREKSFDPDIWIVEIEDHNMRSFVDDVLDL